MIEKPPSAELRADQRDEDSLPPYPVLDAILERLIEDDRSVADVVAAGFDRETVKQVERLIYLSEWKRFQSAPGRPADPPRLLARPPLPDRQPLARPELSGPGPPANNERSVPRRNDAIGRCGRIA